MADFVAAEKDARMPPPIAERRLAPPLDRYRIVGDPLTPLAGAPGCDAAARRVFAPGPDDALPVIPLDAWSAPPDFAVALLPKEESPEPKAEGRLRVS